MNIEIISDEKTYTAEIGKGQSLLHAINRAGVEGFDAPCGGKGTCGKCRIKVLPLNSETPERITGGESALPDQTERKFISEAELGGGIRLACRVFPESDMRIELSSSGNAAVIQSAFDGEIDSSVIADTAVCSRKCFEMSPPSIEDQRSDIDRISDAVAAEGRQLKLQLPGLRSLPGILRKADFKVTLTGFFDEWVAVESGDTAEGLYAAAVDIGTTTVVAYLVDIAGLNRGAVVDLVSGLNSQKGYGGDVISRIEYCMQNEDGLKELHARITGQISSMMKKLAERNGIRLEDIGLVTIAGNTTMTHLFSGLDPKGIAAAPFIPVVNGKCAAPAADFGLDMPSSCSCVVLPGIASYVGSDITSGIAATGMHESDELCLLIDIGTNGEIVLGSKDGLTACSTAAGPALEGANISCGMGGIPGAINRITAERKGEHEIFRFDVIGGGRAAGICGSGIVDAVAIFVDAGLIDETGRILNPDELSEAGVNSAWIECVEQHEGSNVLRIARDITLTQKDIREIQMAKAAIAAGVKTLLAETGRSTSDISRLYISGGFGAAMDKSSAAKIGLIPKELESSVVVAGNTAGKGAILSALSAGVLSRMEAVATGVEYIELSTSALFQQEYMMAMYF